MTENDPKTFEDFKRIMENHWKEEITSPKDLMLDYSKFNNEYIKKYSQNCLFIELLDLQTHFSDQYDNFPFIYPVYFDTVFNIHRDPSQALKRFLSDSIVRDANNLITSNQAKNNLLKLLEENPMLDYYFWNVTFPNILSGFLSDEYCDKAVNFINYFLDDFSIFSKGVTSFIFHNYYFQDSFLKSYYVNSQNKSNSIEFNLQNSLIKSMRKLTIQQFNILEIFLKKYTKEAQEIFLNNIIIRIIKLWKFSPLFQFDLVDYLTDQFINGENHEEKLQKFFEPVIEAIKNKDTTNEIKIERMIFNNVHNFVYTFLDILIIEKVNNNYFYRAQIGPFLDNLNESFIFKKAFYYFVFSKGEGYPADIKKEIKVTKPSFNKTIEKRWKSYCEDCMKQTKNPLEIFYDEEKLSNLLKQDPKFALTGISISYYKWLEYSKVKNVLKVESRAFVPLKAIIESQKNIMEIYCFYYSSIHPIPHENFHEDLMNLFKKTMKNYMIKCMKSGFKRSEQYTDISELYDELKKENKKKNINEKLINEINKKIDNFKLERTTELNELIVKYEQRIDNEFSQNHDFYFNNENSALNLYDLIHIIADEMKDLFNDKSYFNVYIEQMEMLTRSYLIESFNNVKVKIVNPTSSIKFVNYNDIKYESFLPYAASGVFNYINNFVDSLENEDLESNNSIPIGKVFLVIPTIKKFIEQFIAIKDSLPFLVENNIIDEKELIMIILEYAFKFYSNGKVEYVNEEDVVKKKTTHFIQFLATALNMLDSFAGGFYYAEKMNVDFLFLKKYIPI